MRDGNRTNGFCQHIFVSVDAIGAICTYSLIQRSFCNYCCLRNKGRAIVAGVNDTGVNDTDVNDTDVNDTGVNRTSLTNLGSRYKGWLQRINLTYVVSALVNRDRYLSASNSRGAYYIKIPYIWCSLNCYICLKTSYVIPTNFHFSKKLHCGTVLSKSVRKSYINPSCSDNHVVCPQGSPVLYCRDVEYSTLCLHRCGYLTPIWLRMASTVQHLHG